MPDELYPMGRLMVEFSRDVFVRNGPDIKHPASGETITRAQQREDSEKTILWLLERGYEVTLLPIDHGELRDANRAAVRNIP